MKMKVNNIVLFALLIMLSNVSFAKKLNQQPKFESIGDNQPTPGQEYYISRGVGEDLLMMTLLNKRNEFWKLGPFDRTKKSQQTWVFEKNDDGSFSIRTSFNLYLTQSQLKNGHYKLLQRNQNNPLQKFIYERRSLRCPSCDNCVGLSKLVSHPLTFPCPRPVDIKKLLN